MIDPVWLAFLSGIVVGAALLAMIAWVIPAIREARADRRFNAEVIDLATARLQREIRRAKRGRR